MVSGKYSLVLKLTLVLLATWITESVSTPVDRTYEVNLRNEDPDNVSVKLKIPHNVVLALANQVQEHSSTRNEYHHSRYVDDPSREYRDRHQDRHQHQQSYFPDELEINHHYRGQQFPYNDPTTNRYDHQRHQHSIPVSDLILKRINGPGGYQHHQQHQVHSDRDGLEERSIPSYQHQQHQQIDGPLSRSDLSGYLQLVDDQLNRIGPNGYQHHQQHQVHSDRSELEGRANPTRYQHQQHHQIDGPLSRSDLSGHLQQVDDQLSRIGPNGYQHHQQHQVHSDRNELEERSNPTRYQHQQHHQIDGPLSRSDLSGHLQQVDDQLSRIGPNGHQHQQHHQIDGPLSRFGPGGFPQYIDGSSSRSGSSFPLDGSSGRSGSSFPHQVDGSSGRSGSSFPYQVDGSSGRSGSSVPHQVDGSSERSGSSVPHQVDGSPGRSGPSFPHQLDGSSGRSDSVHRVEPLRQFQLPGRSDDGSGDTFSRLGFPKG